MIMRFDKNRADLGCKGTLLGMHLFSGEMEGYLDELVWGLLKNGMKIYPHRHSQKEVYIFIKGSGTMQLDDEIFEVKDGNVVFIPPNCLHTAWNSSDIDLEFILARSRNIRPWIRKIVKLLSI